MQEEKKVDTAFADSIKQKLCMLFLHCVFSKPEFISGEIEKHLEIPEGGVKLRYERNHTDEQGNEVSRYYTLFVYGVELILRYDKRIEEPREIEVPKVVNKPKKWWQREPDTMVVIEKKKSSETPKFHWVLNAIDC